MNCPVCREAMIVLEYEQVEIDHCVSCKGLWLDNGELELLLGDGQSKNDWLAHFEVTSNREKVRKCPICLGKMEKVLVAGKSQLVIDRCKQGDGFWFDLGELEEMIRMDSLGTNSQVLDWLKGVFGKVEQGGVR